MACRRTQSSVLERAQRATGYAPLGASERSPSMVLAEQFIRPDGPDKVTGSGRYAADITLTGMLSAKFRYAGVSHARITHLDGKSDIAVGQCIVDTRYGDRDFGRCRRDAVGHGVAKCVDQRLRHSQRFEGC